MTKTTQYIRLSRPVETSHISQKLLDKKYAELFSLLSQYWQKRSKFRPQNLCPHIFNPIINKELGFLESGSSNISYRPFLTSQEL